MINFRLCTNLTQVYIRALTDWLSHCFDHAHNDTSYIAIRLADVIANDTLEILDLSSMPKQIRSCLYNSLSKFRRLKILDMGHGNGGWLSEEFCNRFYTSGLESITMSGKLTSLRFHHDCTDHLIRILAKNLHNLKCFDISYCQYVTDESAQDIGSMKSLKELEIVGTSLTLQSIQFFLTTLKQLTKLKAVKLAQALETHPQDQELFLTECTPETDRHGFVTATSGRHLALLGAKCKHLETLSYFSEANYDSALDLNNNQPNFDKSLSSQFENLRHLNVWGGRAQAEALIELLGSRIEVLKLVHVEDITLDVIDFFLEQCPDLTELELQNCSLNDQHLIPDVFSPVQAPKLKRLSMTSRCSQRFALKLLSKFPNLTALHCGISTGLSVAIMKNLLLEKLAWKQLRTFHVAHSDQLTIEAIELLLEHCPEIIEIGDIEAFTEICPEDVDKLRHFVKSNNLDVTIALSSNTNSTQSSRNLQSSDAFDVY